MTAASAPSVPAQPPRSLLPLVTVFAALGGFLFGYDTGVISGAIGFIGDEFGLSSLGKGLVTSSVLAKGFLGRPPVAGSESRLDRRDDARADPADHREPRKASAG